MFRAAFFAPNSRNDDEKDQDRSLGA